MAEVKVLKKPREIRVIVNRLVNKKYRVWLESDTSIRSTGQTRSSAIGNLVLLHPEVFGVHVVREQMLGEQGEVLESREVKPK